MTSPIVQQTPVPLAESVKDISQEKKRQKKVSKSTGFQTKLFLLTAPVNSLFQLKKRGRYTYSALQHLEHNKKLRQDVMTFSRAVVSGIKQPRDFELPFHVESFITMPKRYYLVDCRGRLINEFFMEEHSVKVGARLANINAGKRIIVSILDFVKPTAQWI